MILLLVLLFIPILQPALSSAPPFATLHSQGLTVATYRAFGRRSSQQTEETVGGREVKDGHRRHWPSGLILRRASLPIVLLLIGLPGITGFSATLV